MICPITGTRCESSGCTVYIDGRCACIAVPAVEASGTPRCDALQRDRLNSSDDLAWASLARTLERELDTANRACAILRKDVFNLTEKVLPNVRDRAELAERELSRLTRELSAARLQAESERKLSVERLAALVKTEQDRLLLTRELEEARKGERRLDWLERVMFERKWDGTIGRPSTWHMAGPYRHELAKMRGATLREAIDTALSGGGSEG